MIEIDFIGTELLNNSVFDTNLENVAKEQNVFNKEKEYVPLTIILGEKELLEKVENELSKMKTGEEKTVELNEKEGFGERKSDYVRVMPLKVFQDQKINPVPGLVINTGNLLGKVQSVSGGRVRVDFNHPLAGRKLEYWVKLRKEITTKKELAEKFFEKYYSKIPNTKKEIKNEILYITIGGDSLNALTQVNDSIKKLAKNFDLEIVFVEEKKENAKKTSLTNKQKN